MIGLNGKNWKGNIQTLFVHLSGVAGFRKDDFTTIEIDKKNNKLLFSTNVTHKATAELSLDKVIDVRAIDKAMVEKIDPLAAAFLMSLINSSLATATAIATKDSSAEVLKHLIVIRYISNGEEKRIYVERSSRAGWSYGWKKFVAALPKDPNSPFIKKSDEKENHTIL